MIAVTVGSGGFVGKKIFIKIKSSSEYIDDNFIILNSFLFRFLFSEPSPRISCDDIVFNKIPEQDVGDYETKDGKFISFKTNGNFKNVKSGSQYLTIMFSKELVHYDILLFIQNVLIELKLDEKIPSLKPSHAGFYSNKIFFGESDSTGLESDGFIDKL